MLIFFIWESAYSSGGDGEGDPGEEGKVVARIESMPKSWQHKSQRQPVSCRAIVAHPDKTQKIY